MSHTQFVYGRSNLGKIIGLYKPGPFTSVSIILAAFSGICELMKRCRTMLKSPTWGLKETPDLHYSHVFGNLVSSLMKLTSLEYFAMPDSQQASLHEP